MKLAIEHLQTSIAATERALSDAKGTLVATRRAYDESVTAVDNLGAKLGDLKAALNVLRSPLRVDESAPVPEQIVRTDLVGKKRNKPDALSAK